MGDEPSPNERLDGEEALSPIRAPGASTETKASEETTSREEEPDGVFPPDGADLLALLGQVSADAKCRFPDRRGSWSRRIAGATWTPGIFPGDARRAFQLALTFDDGPDSKHTEELLRWLKQADIQATFFVVGQQIHSGTYTLIQQILRDGHVLGNHSFRHDTAHTSHGAEVWGDDYLLAEYRFTQMRVDMAFLAKSAADFRAADRRIFGRDGLKMPPSESARQWPDIERRYAQWLGERGYAAIHPPARMLWARPPGGNPWFGPDTDEAVDQRAHIARAMRVAGMAIVLWDIDTRDWWHLVHTEEEMRGAAIADSVSAEWGRGGVTLFHDRVPLAALAELQQRAAALEHPLALVTLNTLAQQQFGCSVEELARELTLQNLDASVDAAHQRLRSEARD